MEARNQVFQTLKPHCVKLNQAVLQFSAGNASVEKVADGLAQLVVELRSLQDQQRPLNDKLAEYIFFPLSHVLREAQKLPTRVLELSLRALQVLLQTGWKAELAPELGLQLLILLTFFADGKASDGKLLSSSEELQHAAYQCLSGVFISLQSTTDGKGALTQTRAIPAIGHSVTVMLRGVLEGGSLDVQLAALVALQEFCMAVPDKDILRNFFPGIISSLTKTLTLTTKSRRSYKVLSRSLDLLSSTLDYVLSNGATQSNEVVDDGGDVKSWTEETARHTSWLTTTTSKVDMALANVVKLRQHSRVEVREALARLCVTVLERCEKSLHQSQPMMLETLVKLAADDTANGCATSLRCAIAGNSELVEQLRSSLHSWIVSLPRIMQSEDDSAKSEMLRRISLAFDLIGAQDLNMDVLLRNLTVNLRDSLAISIPDRSRIGTFPTSDLSLDSTDLSVVALSQESTEFRSVLLTRKNERDIADGLTNLMERVGEHRNCSEISRELVSSMQTSNGNTLIASFWLALRMLQKSARDEDDLSELLNIETLDSGLKGDLADEVYAQALVTVTNADVDPELDWRLTAVALEGIAFHARQHKSGFRAELVDALYPVIHLIGSPQEEVRLHAMTCLNTIAEACGSCGPRDLLISNVDYLVNSVAIKLNTFDISPQAPQVLMMMVKLSGPALLPYVDDLVESIFAALEHFHGYSKLVELLFSALRGIAEEGSKAPQLKSFNENTSSSLLIQSTVPRTNQDRLLGCIKDLKRAHETETLEETEDLSIKLHLSSGRVPSKERHLHNFRGSKEDEAPDDRLSEDSEVAESLERTPPPAGKTYKLLLNISRLTQHYLPSASPSLRTSLLSLLKETLPALATHEDSFLPLVHTIWPVLLPRLADTEAYVVANALDLMAAMCVHAGDFMKGRIEGAWGDIRRVHEPKIEQTSATRREGTEMALSGDRSVQVAGALPTTLDRSSTAYVDAPTRMIWESLVNLLTSIVEFVSVDDETFDDILDILSPSMEHNSCARTSLQRRNPDAVWLQMSKRKMTTDKSGATDQSVRR